MIGRIIACLLFCLLPFGAFAQSTCLINDPTWVTPYSQGNISFIAYMLTTQRLVVQFRDQTIQAFTGVPQGIAQAFTQMVNPTTYYQTNIPCCYHQAMLSGFQPLGYCPLLNDDGVTWLLTH